uniref:RdRp n=1 Tax=Hubei coleoptera virus 6 TaxID=1922865 RepID=A0A1L3KLD5_9VIRU|nr:RdRp [Hubei coleoptera virus 6]
MVAIDKIRTITYLPPFARECEAVAQRPTKFRSSSRCLKNAVNKYLDTLRSTEPSGFDLNIDLDDILTQETYYPLHFNDVKEYNHKGSPGPMFSSYGYKTQHDVYSDPKAVRTMRKIQHLIKSDKPVSFCWRAAVASATETIDGKVKQRVVMVPDLTLLHMEKMFAQPIVDSIHHESRALGARNYCKRMCGPNLVQLDIKSFDMSVPAWLIQRAFQILFSRFCFTHYYSDSAGFQEVSKRYSLLHCVNVIISNFIHSKFLADQYKFQKHHGVPSGSAFTNLVDTVVSRLLAHNALLDQGISDAIVSTYGDDTSIKLQRLLDFDPDKCGEYYRNLGFEIEFEPLLPNNHGVFGKEWCLGNGVGYHPGIFYRNIINCIRDTRYLGLLGYALISTFSMTPRQATGIIQYTGTDFEVRKPPLWLTRLITHGGDKMPGLEAIL